MIVYGIVDFLIIISWFLFGNQKSEKNIRIWIGFTCLVLIFITAFRGDFSTDYNNYVDLYEWTKYRPLKEVLFDNLFCYPERGYRLFQYIIYHLLDNHIYIFVFSAILIVLANIKTIYKYCGASLVAVILYVECGNFFTSYNLLRQVMAASIAIIGIKYLVDKKFVKYLLVVLISACFHKTALILIPVYFLCNIKFSKKTIAIYATLTALAFAFVWNFINIIQKYTYSWYAADAYGMTGYSWKNAIVSIAIVVFVIGMFLFKQKKNGELLRIEQVGLHFTCLLFVFSILGFKVMMLSRFVSFFDTMAIITAANYAKVKDGGNRFILSALIIILALIFGFLAKDSIGYYFVWG